MTSASKSDDSTWSTLVSTVTGYPRLPGYVRSPIPATVVLAPSSSRRIFGYHSSRSSYCAAAKISTRFPLRVIRGTYIFGPHESTAASAYPRQSRDGVPRSVRTSQEGGRRAPHAGSRRRVSARAAAARSAARYSRQFDRHEAHTGKAGDRWKSDGRHRYHS